MLNLLNKVTYDRKTVGYKVASYDSMEYYLRLELIEELVANNLITGLVLDAKGRIKGVGLDLRKITVLNANKEQVEFYGGTCEDLMTQIEKTNKTNSLFSTKHTEWVDKSELLKYKGIPNHIVAAYLYLAKSTEIRDLEYFKGNKQPLVSNWEELARKDNKYCNFISEVYTIHYNLNSVLEELIVELSRFGYVIDDFFESEHFTKMNVSFTHRDNKFNKLDVKLDVVNLIDNLSIRIRTSVVKNDKYTANMEKNKTRLSRIYKSIIRKLNKVSIVGYLEE